MFRVFAFFTGRFTYQTPITVPGLVQMITLQRLGD